MAVKTSLHLTAVFVWLLAVGAGAQPLGTLALRTGDLLLQDLDCGPLCDAIESVTPHLDGRAFSHIGLVVADTGAPTVVIEAVSRGGVVATPLDAFLTRAVDSLGRPQVVQLRLRENHRALIPAAVAFAKAQYGTPYDAAYLPDNGRYYCSELLADAFRAANGGEEFFAQTPMTFRPPGSPDFDPAWVAYYEALGAPIPQGEPGCNPGSIAVDARLEVVEVLGGGAATTPGRD